ncbi:hypothetical protein K7I13_00940 [Brucepastera parasyntrophica]|uniref:hypothetical protein n=1 Tax=Brucepastera parasyntrophica TaxID=2880008 RepID=UPI00210C5D33|nr:hypothetical protein [Brucepastera parasyntrophica]ULQ59944.1 hypothetical protein K7I13_00940 [Brucepastera parasyntrophica]
MKVRVFVLLLVMMLCMVLPAVSVFAQSRGGSQGNADYRSGQVTDRESQRLRDEARAKEAAEKRQKEAEAKAKADEARKQREEEAAAAKAKAEEEKREAERKRQEQQILDQSIFIWTN